MRIIIAGGGFGGISCARKLGGFRNEEIILISRSEMTTMLPSLPDVAGGRVRATHMQGMISRLIPSNIRLVVEAISNIDVDTKTVTSESGRTFQGDILVIATGAETNFYGFKQNLDKIFRLESVSDCLKLNEAVRNRLAAGTLRNIVIGGAGFTGLETGANMIDLLKKNPSVSVHFIEKTDQILVPTEPKLAAYVQKSMESSGAVFHMKETVTGFDGNTVSLQNGGNIPEALFVWCSGLKRAVNVTGKIEALPNGRLCVDGTLRLPGHDRVFAVGDCSAFTAEGRPLRMAVNFAQMMGSHAGRDIRYILRGTTLLTFKPIDMGWVLPVNHTSVGNVFNIRLYGRIGIFMHFVIIGIKNYSIANLFAYLRYAVRFFFTPRVKR
jgi:NADH:ubiquinone reductase (H+-translocating)